MRIVTIELDDLYDDVLSITAIGTDKNNNGIPRTVNITTANFVLSKGTFIQVDKNGVCTQK